MSVDHDDMSEVELDARPDAALDGWLADVSSAVENDLVRTNVPWDFAAMLARAHALDPSVVSAQAVAEAEQAEPVISLAQRRSQRATRDDPAFANLVEDVRAANEHDAALRTAAAAAGAVPRRVAPGFTSGRVLGLVVALAAVVVVGLGVVRGVQVLTERRNAPADAAVHQGGASSDALERAVIDDGEQESPSAPTRLVPEPIAAEAIELPTVVEPPVPIVAVRTPKKGTRPAKPAITEPAVPQPTLTERLAALDGAAHAAWKAGDLGIAEEKFEALIALAGTSRLADLAYGDLFTLARRRGDTKREVALWKRYLAAFDRGRFSDDARAGLCRKSATDKPACWRDYLADFPEGSYRAQAERDGGSAP